MSDAKFPYSLIIRTPLPTARHAAIAQRALAVDAELSPLVQRSFSLAASHDDSHTSNMYTNGTSHDTTNGTVNGKEEQETTLVTHYSATTPRMLRVSVNGFFESLRVVLGVMRELDVDVVGDAWVGDEGATEAEANEVKEMRKVQGLEESGVIGGMSKAER